MPETVPNGVVGRSRDRMTHVRFYKLCSWMHQNAERLLREKPLYEQAALQAEKELGFAVNRDQVREAREITGVQWESPVGYRGRGISRDALVKAEALEGRLRQAEADVACLRSLVHHLYAELSAKPPDGYKLPPARTTAVL